MGPVSFFKWLSASDIPDRAKGLRSEKWMSHGLALK